VLDELRPPDSQCPLVFPSPSGGYFDLHNFGNRYWRLAQQAAGITPRRRVYDVRHTFATFALRAGISTFDLSRYMGTSLAMIDRHYGHLARDGREHAIRLLDSYKAEALDVHAVDAPWTSNAVSRATADNERAPKQRERRSPLTDSNRRPPPYHGGALPTELRGRDGTGYQGQREMTLAPEPAHVCKGIHTKSSRRRHRVVHEAHRRPLR
jgi:hypothetical protein